ncbi:hypothetical protein [Variovorax saccharolyticus]|uniref:hypothetical protein n=1 Tax=Variovorax saccharolyticus TaxID=3053516 RepID=UPI002576FB2D|nr:hypothetical protein [Variovorax sp. J31P216]MDM0030480.1 hypothetical protein [Variovorax sp. J31P216]
MSDWAQGSEQIGSGPMWNINWTFLDQQMVWEKSFVFAFNPALARAGSYTIQEYEYLVKFGYKFEAIPGGMYRAIKK